MGVMMQAFYWDCPKIENREFGWWNHVRDKIATLSEAGFTALWLPPASKAANISGMSMGYDPYDYFDLGDIDQKGSIPTWFGTRNELAGLIGAAHEAGVQVYADIVINHNSGADAAETNPLNSQQCWTRFNPGSGRFPRDWRCFHPSSYESYDGYVFEGMPDLCHRNPHVYMELIEHARWMLEDIGFDGFRYDCVKGYGGWMVRAIQELRGLRNGMVFRPFGVGECWDSNRRIEEWLDEANAWTDNPAAAFDFELRNRLKNLCDRYGYSLTGLAAKGALFSDRPYQAVTFVENHDIVRNEPIINDKMLAYAFILTHEGYPCVFWQDYFNWGLALEGTRSGIAALVEVHEESALGETSVLHADDSLYVMERKGLNGRGGLVFVLNSQPRWNGAWVRCSRANCRFGPAAWRGRDNADTPQPISSNGECWAEFWAPPRGYAVYVPER